MIDFRPIIHVIGILLAVLAAAMMLPVLTDWLNGFEQDAVVFAACAAGALFIGVSAMLAARTGEIVIDNRQSFMLATLAWIVLAGFAALPFAYSNLGLSAAGAFFEAMAGVTTTASTVITGLDSAPPGILLWRALLQWLGGMGTITFVILALPNLQVAGMQLFRLDTAESAHRAMPRAAQIVAGIALVYVALTALCATGLRLAGMTGFEAVAHAMAAISTGGFSTADQSIAHFRSPLIDAILIVFMILGSLPFFLYLQALRGNPRRLLRESQIHWLLAVLAVTILLMTAWHWHHSGERFLHALDECAFNVVSIVTGTGFTTAHYDSWGGLAIAAFLFLTIVGGCAGSASGGIKIFRFQVIYASADTQIRRMVRPNGLFIPYFNGRPIPDTVANAVMGFFFLFAVSFALLALGLSLLGLDLLTSLSGAASALSNVGAGLGPVIGPSGSFATLPDGAKWLLSFGMLLGRLDLYTVLVLLVPAFWRG